MQETRFELSLLRPTVGYLSNRWEKQIERKQKEIPDKTWRPHFRVVLVECFVVVLIEYASEAQQYHSLTPSFRFDFPANPTI